MIFCIEKAPLGLRLTAVAPLGVSREMWGRQHTKFALALGNLKILPNAIEILTR